MPQEAQAMPVGQFVAELQELARAEPIEPSLVQRLKYGRSERDHVRRWAKEYYRYVEHDAQATAAVLASCLDRKLFLELSAALARKAGFYQVANPLDLYRKFTEALGVSREEIERHVGSAETLGALFTKRSFQHSGFLEGFTASMLAGEGALAEVSSDDSPFLCQKGFAEYVRRAYGLPEGATDYWRAYEDFHSLDGERAWQIAAELAMDASSQQTMRRTFRHSLAVYRSMRKAWSDIVSGTYWDGEIRWPDR